MNARSLLLVTPFFLAACGPRAVFAPFGQPMPTRPKPVSAVTIHGMGARPACDYVVVGIITGKANSRDYGDVGLALNAVRDEAAARGLDGVIDMKCADPGTVGYENGTCAGQAYYCR